jgi:serine protease Do
VTEEIAESLGLEKAEGALVGNVMKNGPASSAGIRTGDVILWFDGKKVKNQIRLPRMVAETDVGKRVIVKVWRDGTEVGLTVNLGELEKVDEASLSSLRGGEKEIVKSEVIDELGISLASLTRGLIKKFQLDANTKGVVITGIEAQSDAARKGLQPGDIIVEVNQANVNSPGDVEAKVQEALELDRRSVLLQVRRGNDLNFVALRISSG